MVVDPQKVEGSLSLPLLPPSPLPLELGPLNLARGLERAVSSPAESGAERH